MSYSKIEELLALKKTNRIFSKATIKSACKEGNLLLLHHLLDEGEDPSKRNNEAIRIAAKYGKVHIVKELLQDPRVNPGAKENEALLNAVQKKHVEVVKELLGDSRVEGSQIFLNCLQNSHWKGSVGGDIF